MILFGKMVQNIFTKNFETPHIKLKIKQDIIKCDPNPDEMFCFLKKKEKRDKIKLELII